MNLTIRKPMLIAAWGAILSAIVGLVVNLYWLTWPYGGLVLDPLKMTIDQASVTAGDLMTYSVHYCVDGDIPLPITVNRELELQGDAMKLSFPIAPPLAYQITERCETRRLVVGIPNYLPAGMYHVHAHVALQVNPVRAVRQEFQSTEFRVTK